MGVQGAGKSTIGAVLAVRLGVPFVDGDDLHPRENKLLMAQGRPLSDEMRVPWLDAVGDRLAVAPDGVVVACSALKRSYRDRLRAHAPDAFVAHLHGPMEVVRQRLYTRTHEYMPPELLRSQFDTLEPLEDEVGIVVDLRRSPAEMVDQIVGALDELDTRRARDQA